MKSKAEISGIGGWMILPILGFIGTIIWTGYNLASIYPNIGPLLRLLERPATSLETKIAVILSSTLGIFVIISALAALISIFRKSQHAPVIVTVHFLILIGASFSEYWGDVVFSTEFNVATDPQAPINAIKILIFGILWITYFQRSRRVKNTFRPHPAPPPPPPSNHPIIADTRAEEQPDHPIG